MSVGHPDKLEPPRFDSSRTRHVARVGRSLISRRRPTRRDAPPPTPAADCPTAVVWTLVAARLGFSAILVDEGSQPEKTTRVGGMHRYVVADPRRLKKEL